MLESHASTAAPGPRRWPVLGNVGAFAGMLPFVEDMWRRHGDVFRMRVLNFDALVVSHPEQIQQVLVTNRHNYYKGRVYEPLRKMFGDGLLTLDGEAWKQRRTLAQPSFHRQALEKLTAIMSETGAHFLDGLAARVGSGAEIDLHKEMIRLTLDVVVTALFGRGLIEDSQISYRALGEALELLTESVNGVQLPAWLPTPHNLKFQRVMRELDVSVYRTISAAREREGEPTLLAMLLAARDEHGQPLSDSTLRDEVLTLFIAGHETTALTLTWLFALVSEAPEVISRMRAEVDSVLEGRAPTFADVLQLSYLRQVIDESLRLRPPAPMLARNAVAGDRLGKFEIEAGGSVLALTWAVHRHPDFWPDPLRFDPERFAPGAAKSRHVCSYIPFGAGPRVCIGNQFSLIETALLIAQLFTRFDVQVASCADVRPLAVGTVRPSKPIRVRLTPRKQN